jgi:hypothetical protein
MASLYEINEEILNCIDLETGEILDEEKFNALSVDRDAKIENVALYYKNLLSEADAIRAEKNVFADREKVIRNKADNLKKYLDASLNGNKFSTVKVNISYRKSASLEYDGTSEVPEEYLKYADPSIDKTAVTKDIKDGKSIKGFVLKENNNIQIK